MGLGFRVWGSGALRNMPVSRVCPWTARALMPPASKSLGGVEGVGLKGELRSSGFRVRICMGYDMS